MFPIMERWWLVILLLRVVAAIEVKLSVVEPMVAERLLVAASAEAAAEAEGAAVAEGVAVAVAPVEAGEQLDVPLHVCAAAAAGVHAVITGVSGGTELSGAAAARAGLALLLAGGGEGGSGGGGGAALAFYPREDVLLQAAAELVKEKEWQRAVLLHAGSARGAPALAGGGGEERLELVTRQLPPPGDDAMLRDLLLVLKKAGLVNFIVACEAAQAAVVLDAALRAGLLAERHAWLVLALELHTQDLRNFSHGGANITGLMMFDPESEDVMAAVSAINVAAAARAEGGLAPLRPGAVPTPLLLALDAAALAARALRDMELPDDDDAWSGSCDSGVGAFHADTLLNYLRSREHRGVTGLLSWEADGARRGLVLQVVELERGGRLQRAGSWSAAGGVSWRRAPRPAPPPPSDSMANRTFNILIAESEPYIMKKKSTERMSGNARYEGFGIELIDRLAKMLNFNYTLVEQEDRKYGNEDPVTHQWDGMLRKIMDDDNYQFAITDLTITAERERAVDFTTPFMNLGISIVFRRPMPPGPELLAFLLPFSNGVWLGLGLALLGTSLVLYVVGRLCPEEWQNPYPCVDEPVALENQFTIGNAVWFNLGAMLLQGSEIAPVAYGTRAVASVWWLFALVITSSYTANLATLLAKKTNAEVIKDVTDLANNELGITYGAKVDGATYNFFKGSKNELYQKMYEHMRTQELPTSNPEGLDWVKTKDFAYLMESTSIEYAVERDCDVYQVGDLLDSKGYGIAMRKNSTYRQAMNLALLRLQEDGTLREMKQQWWQERNGGGACKPKDDYESENLKMNSFYGLFLVLVVGCALGVLVSCCDLAMHARRAPRAPLRPFLYNFMHELRFVFRFNESSKPLQGPLIESKSPSATSMARETGSGTGSGGEEEAAEAEAAAEAAAEAEAAAARCESALSGRARRRRSSMHNASVRLARHARQ